MAAASAPLKLLPLPLPPAGTEPITGDQVKLAFKKAALQLHPDKHVGREAALQAEAGEKFRRLQVRP